MTLVKWFMYIFFFINFLLSTVVFLIHKTVPLYAFVSGMNNYKHAEARGIHALLSRGISPYGAKQATTLKACKDCINMQKNIILII